MKDNPEPVEMDPERKPGRATRHQMNEKLELLAAELAAVKNDLFGLARIAAQQQFMNRALCRQLINQMHPLSPKLLTFKDMRDEDEALMERYLRNTTEGESS